MIEMCVGCGRPILVHRMLGVVVKCEPTPLAGPEAVGEILAGRQLWTVDLVGGKPHGLKPAQPGEHKPLREHHCPNGSRGPVTASQEHAGPVAQPQPPKAPAAPWRASSGPSRPARAGGVARPTFEARRTGPSCSACGRPCSDGTYASVEVGDLVVWAQHVIGPCAG